MTAGAFAEDHALLLSRELPRARLDPARLAAMVGVLTEALALTIAIGAQGDPDGINTLCEGISVRLLEGAAERAPLGAFFRGAA